jgi:hypothetical protein
MAINDLEKGFSGWPKAVKCDSLLGEREPVRGELLEVIS